MALWKVEVTRVEYAAAIMFEKARRQERQDEKHHRLRQRRSQSEA